MNTKICPYCAEEIQFGALKCKHCGEWLNKKENSFLGKFKEVVSVGIEKIHEKHSDYVAKSNSHLYEPTREHPFRLNNLEIFPDYLIVDNKVKINYDEVFGIFFFCESRSYSGVRSTTNVIFHILFSDRNKNSAFPEDSSDLKLYHGEQFLSKRELEVIFYAKQLLELKTINYRLQRYKFEIAKNGFFPYVDGTTIYNNGILVTNKGLKYDIRKYYLEGKVALGDTFVGLKSKESDPYAFKIYESSGTKVKLLGIELGNRFEISTHYNNDLFVALIISIIQNGYCFVDKIPDEISPDWI